MTRSNNFDLPEGVRALADVIGRERALFLAGHFLRWDYEPGRRQGISGYVYIPKRLGVCGRRLVELVGAEDAARLVRELGGAIIYLSACKAVTQRWKAREAARMAREGVEQVEIGAVLGVTSRTVRTLLSMAA